MPVAPLTPWQQHQPWLEFWPLLPLACLWCPCVSRMSLSLLLLGTEALCILQGYPHPCCFAAKHCCVSPCPPWCPHVPHHVLVGAAALTEHCSLSPPRLPPCVLLSHRAMLHPCVPPGCPQPCHHSAGLCVVSLCPQGCPQVCCFLQSPTVCPQGEPWAPLTASLGRWIQTSPRYGKAHGGW